MSGTDFLPAKEQLRAGIVLSLSLASVLWADAAAGSGEMPDPPGQIAGDEQPVQAAYLFFSYITHADYGRLYYSVSTDGLHWRRLNDGRRVSEEYKGHPDVCRAARWTLHLDRNGNYRSADLVNSSGRRIISSSGRSIAAWLLSKECARLSHGNPGDWIPPKLFYDQASEKADVVTSHTPHQMESR